MKVVADNSGSSATTSTKIEDSAQSANHSGQKSSSGKSSIRGTESGNIVPGVFTPVLAKAAAQYEEVIRGLMMNLANSNHRPQWTSDTFSAATPKLPHSIETIINGDTQGAEARAGLAPKPAASKLTACT
jgi:hypothetical protein